MVGFDNSISVLVTMLGIVVAFAVLMLMYMEKGQEINRLVEAIIFTIIVVGIGTLVHEYVHVVQHEHTGLFNGSYIGFSLNLTMPQYKEPVQAVYIYSTFKPGVTQAQIDVFNNNSLAREGLAYSIEILFIVVVFLISVLPQFNKFR